MIAIILGFALGLVITLGIWQANQAIQRQNSSQTTKNESPTPSVASQEKSTSISLSIIKPEDESLVSSDKITVSGTSEPFSQIAIIGEKSEEIIQADDKGVFTTEVSLVSGTNEISISAFDPDSGQEIQKTVNVVYSTTQI